MSETRICAYCGAAVPAKDWCPACIAAFPQRQPAAAMPPGARAAEMRRFAGPVSLPFNLIHQRIEELVGRPVWIHEMGLDWDGLVAEAGAQREASTMEGIIDLIPENRRIVVRVECDARDPAAREDQG